MTGSRAFVLGITADYAFAAGALVASIRPQARDAALVILHDGLAEDQEAAFMRLWPGCRLQTFDAAGAVTRLGGGDQVAAFLEQYSPLVLAKLGLPDLLDEFERVVWMDADILVRGPLEALWDFDCLAWRALPEGAFKRRERALSVFAELAFDPGVPLLNGGVIGVSRRFLELGGSSSLLHDFAQRLAAEAPSSQIDELPWYLAAASRGMPVTRLPMGMNHPVGLKGVEGAAVVHAIGAHKFWNATPLLQQFPDWLRHQETWVGHGGQAYDGPVLLSEVHPEEPTEVFRAAKAREHWLEVFRELRPVLPKGMVVDLQHHRAALRIFLHGRPENECLVLKRHHNDRRISLEVMLPTPLAVQVVESICREIRWSRHERDALVSVPIKQLGATLATVETVLATAALSR